MTDIVIEYNLLGAIPIRFHRKMPDKWEEMSPQQLITVVDVYDQLVSDRKALSRLINLPWFVAKNINPVQMHEVILSLNFIREYKACNFFIIGKIRKDLMPPGPLLKGMSWGQFMMVDSYYNDYVSTGNEQSLNKFLASLYTPGRFEQEMILDGVKKVSRCNKKVKQAITINYRLVLEWLMGKYPVVFKRRSVASVGFQKKSSPDWVSLHDNIVGDDIVNSSKYAEKSVHEILRFITRKINQDVKRR